MKARFLFLPLLLIGLAVMAACSSALLDLSKATGTAITTTPTLQCGAVAVPGCLTPAQVQQVEGDLNTISTAGATYTAKLQAAGGDAKKVLPDFATFVLAVGPPMDDIAKVAGTNASLLLTNVKSAIQKL